jgi:Chalcone isomerase-like
MYQMARILTAMLLCTAGQAMTDKATGIAFSPKKHGLEIFGVGVRKKGPIKIYSVARYGSSSLKESLSKISRSKNEKEALLTLQQGARSENTTFLLEMAFKVGAEKMASAIAESVSPRHKGDAKEVEELRDIIFKGVSDKGAVKGTRLEFECAPSGINVTINGKAMGSLKSTALAAAFCDVYSDDKCVSPSLRANCLENCCAP